VSGPQDSDLRAEIFRLVVAKGWTLLELRREAQSLDAVFRDLTRREERLDRGYEGDGDDEESEQDADDEDSEKDSDEEDSEEDADDEDAEDGEDSDEEDSDEEDSDDQDESTGEEEPEKGKKG
jgi:hypothetical protein